MSNYKLLSINPSSPEDRKALFIRICELLNLNSSKEAEKLKVKTTSAGLNINIEILFKFLYSKKLKGKFNFEEKTLSVSCIDKPSVGKAPIENPETIGKTSVDDIKEVGVDKNENKSDSNSQEEDDDPF